MSLILSAPRPCESCHGAHPVATTCAGGWAPWDGSPYVPPPTPAVVTLTDLEYEQAVDRAEAIIEMNRKRGWQMRFMPVGKETVLDVNIRGYAAEIAAANATGLPLNWDAYLSKDYRRAQKPHDIGQRTEVRNARKTAGALFARKNDPKDRVYLLATGLYRTYAVVGWMEGVDLIDPGRWQEKPAVAYPGYVADQRELHALPLPPDA